MRGSFMENMENFGQKLSLNAYAMKVLSEHGCDCYTYGDEDAKHILEDLKTAYPNGMEYPYIEVANEILSMSRPRPIYKAPYKMIYDMGHTVDSTEHQCFETAKDEAIETLVDWIVEQKSLWKSDTPTEEEKGSFNMMIQDCSVEVVKYNPDTDEYEDCWMPTYEDEKAIGWEYIE